MKKGKRENRLIHAIKTLRRTDLFFQVSALQARFDRLRNPGHWSLTKLTLRLKLRVCHRLYFLAGLVEFSHTTSFNVRPSAEDPQVPSPHLSPLKMQIWTPKCAVSVDISSGRGRHLWQRNHLPGEADMKCSFVDYFIAIYGPVPD